MERLEERVRNYWTRRAADFSTVRRMELQDDISNRWMEVIESKLPRKQGLRILDVGTGTGYFAILLAERGYQVHGIDLTPAMIAEARNIALDRGLTIPFSVMDAQKLEFESESFDVVIARNLTWTLPKPEQAYSEWMRVLVKGGLLLNFDADYGQQVLSQEEGKSSYDNISGFHIGLTKEMLQESNEITKAMGISGERRPEWDMAVIRQLGYKDCDCDREAGSYILKDRNGAESPTFLLVVQK